jgi:UDP-N-acetylglucosamine--N-acetylmuramyl-(pentapeptide) pyrophosphoryl-undecaprenol N-acetylglucosamine transferase
MKVLLAAGGTAGHIVPALALADALASLDGELRVTVLGTSRGLETRLVRAAGYPLELIPAVPLPRRPGRDLAAVPLQLVAAVRAAGRVLEVVAPDVVVGFGGYAALPTYLAACRRRVPIVVHEANAQPGLANRIGARCTRRVAASFPGTPLPHAVLTGLPIRRAVADLARDERRQAAREHFGLAPQAPVLLVFGGSQGARSLNRAVTSAAPALADAGAQVLLAAGSGKAGEVVEELDGHPEGWVVLDYIESMQQAYAAADLALCRSGANTVAELAAVGLPAAYVPLAIGNGEQRKNAAPVVAAGGGLLVADAELGPGWITGTLVPLLADTHRLAAMGAAARQTGRPDADTALARMVLAAGHGG